MLLDRFGKTDSKDIDSGHDDQLDGAKDAGRHGVRPAEFNEVPFHDTPLFLQCDILDVNKTNLSCSEKFFYFSAIIVTILIRLKLQMCKVLGRRWDVT
jgi:hypothetical protein